MCVGLEGVALNECESPICREVVDWCLLLGVEWSGMDCLECLDCLSTYLPTYLSTCLPAYLLQQYEIVEVSQYYLSNFHIHLLTRHP